MPLGGGPLRKFRPNDPPDDVDVTPMLGALCSPQLTDRGRWCAADSGRRKSSDVARVCVGAPLKDGTGELRAEEELWLLLYDPWSRGEL